MGLTKYRTDVVCFSENVDDTVIALKKKKRKRFDALTRAILRSFLSRPLDFSSSRVKRWFEGTFSLLLRDTFSTLHLARFPFYICAKLYVSIYDPNETRYFCIYRWERNSNITEIRISVDALARWQRSGRRTSESGTDGKGERMNC